MNLRLFIFALLYLPFGFARAQDAHCTNNPARSWWDVQRYELYLNVDTATGKLSGTVIIRAKAQEVIGDSLQIDLQEPLHVNSISGDGKDGSVMTFTPEKRGDHYIIKGDFQKLIKEGAFALKIGYEGIPLMAARPPWSGGLVMDRDKQGTRWMGVACQDIGASVWFPCKDFQGDEPDQGILFSMYIPANLKMISNGRCLTKGVSVQKGITLWTWVVNNPINNYDISFYIGDYMHWSDTLDGVKGKLSLDYYVLPENLSRAKQQFEVVKPMLHCFEEKMGPYPFYEDGYKLVDAPYLGMEHQSAVAYGNAYRMGYEGKDRSKTGVGLKFDFIIVHESGHEWFGNNITAYDKADTWIHEGFTTYTETIFAECLLGKEAAFRYQQGKRPIIHNDRPAQGIYNQCDEGSGDHYDKAAFMIHMIRMIMDNDTQFFGMLQAMNSRFYHKIVTGREVEQFINTYSGKDFSKVFEQYLRYTFVPKLALKIEDHRLSFRWEDCTPGFDMPVRIYVGGAAMWIHPAADWRTVAYPSKEVSADLNFLIDIVPPSARSKK